MKPDTTILHLNEAQASYSREQMRLAEMRQKGELSLDTFLLCTTHLEGRIKEVMHLIKTLEKKAKKSE